MGASVSCPIPTKPKDLVGLVGQEPMLPYK